MAFVETIHPVILCGGSGTRLWPLSRKSQPKQFARLMGDASLFQRAINLVSDVGFAKPTVVTGEAFRFITTEQLSDIGAQADAVLIEPEARNTAPAILAAALHVSKVDPHALMLVLPSDHLINNPQAFRAAIRAAQNEALGGKLVTFGIEPTRPETGYGYLELATAEACQSNDPQDLLRFIEKPDQETARTMVATGRYLWNAGIFLFSASAIIKAFHALAPTIGSGVQKAVANATEDLGFTRLNANAWADLPSISVDYAIMEKADNLAVMPFSHGWTDLGDWKSVWHESAKDEAGNACSGQNIAMDCSNTLIRSDHDGLQVVGIGLDDLIVISTADAVLVAPKSQSQRVGEAVSEMRARGLTQAEQGVHDQRPWGAFKRLAVGDKFQVKHIRVKPGQAISLQSHNHRAEHWIVVAGTAKVTIGDDVRLVSENESVYVPLGAIHRLENPGVIPVEIIEVQTGDYLGEDDITRYADNYARS